MKDGPEKDVRVVAAMLVGIPEHIARDLLSRRAQTRLIHAALWVKDTAMLGEDIREWYNKFHSAGLVPGNQADKFITMVQPGGMIHVEFDSRRNVTLRAYATHDAKAALDITRKMIDSDV